MVDSNVPVLFEQLIGAPLQAIVNAQSLSAAATYDFLLNLTEVVDNKRILKNAEFQYQRTLMDPQKGEIAQKQLLTVPLVTLLPIPYLNVDAAEINFNAKVIAHQEGKSGNSPIKSVLLYTTYSSSKSVTDINSDLQVKITIKRGEIPEGLAKALTVLHNNAIKVDDI